GWRWRWFPDRGRFWTDLSSHDGRSFSCVGATVERGQRRTGCCVLALGTAADLAPRPVVPLGIGTTPRRYVLNQANAVAGHTAAGGHAGRLQVRAAFERGYARLGGAKADTAVGAHLPLGPDVPLGKLLVRRRRWAVHACKGRAYGAPGAE